MGLGLPASLVQTCRICSALVRHRIVALIPKTFHSVLERRGLGLNLHYVFAFNFLHSR